MDSLRSIFFTIFSPLNTDLLTPDGVRPNLFTNDVAFSFSSRMAILNDIKHNKKGK